MREWIPLGLSVALLALPPAEGRATSPDSNSPPEVKAAVEFVEDLIGKRIRTLAVLHPHLESEFSEAQTVFLTEREYNDLGWLKKSVFPLLEGCSVENGVMLDATQVQVKFGLPCGSEWTGPLSGVIVPMAYDREGNPYPRGPLAFIPFDK